MASPALAIVPPRGFALLPLSGPCRFRLVAQQGRGSNRRAIYVCVAHAYPSGCLPYATKPLPR